MTIVRRFEPVIISTKEELLSALRAGDIKTSKYNLLNEDQKLFVEMIVFGGYSAIEAIKVIRPKAKSYKALANRWIALPNVAETLEELSKAKDRKFMAEVTNARDMALAKLQFIMSTTQDESLAAVCAKTILDKAEKAITSRETNDGVVEGIKFAIELAKEVNMNKNFNGDEPIIINSTPIEKNDDAVEAEYEEGPNGLPYTFSYESIDNYHAVDNEDEE